MRKESVTPNHPWHADPPNEPQPQPDEGSKSGERDAGDKVPKKG